MLRVYCIRVFLVLLLPAILALPGWGVAFSKTLKADLTGSGKNDVIILSGKTDENNDVRSYLLKVDATSIKRDIAPGEIPKLSIVAIDSSDKRKEIVVNAFGPGRPGSILDLLV